MGIRFFIPLPGPFYYSPGRKHPKQRTRSSGTLETFASNLEASAQQREIRLAKWREAAHNIAHSLDIADPDHVDLFVRHYVAGESARRGTMLVGFLANLILLFAFPFALIITLPAYIFTVTPYGRAWFARESYKQYLAGKKVRTPYVAVCACDQVA